MNLEAFLVVGAVLFAIGLYGALTKRNAIAVFMSLELMFNAVNLTAVAFSRYILPARIAAAPDAPTTQALQTLLTGQVLAIFVITVAAAEVALGIAIVFALYRKKESVFVTDANLMSR